jgi:chaperonin cofactor prefoldin|tara:strand:+ start:947 stop:1108 length:162 start_codon:yes stop_codon:yes gene_type:complete
MATASRKEELEKKIEALKEEARRLKIRLSCIDDQISDFVGDLRMLENDTEQNS